MEDRHDTAFIHIKGAREHNLRDIDLRLPRNRLTVITGVSGSGKSSLAFDTLHAEGYRKYMDSLSTRARQWLEQVPRPDVDFIHGLSPVIAIGQRSGNAGNPRTTVATATEIADYARLLWALAGTAHCPLDGAPIVRRSLDDNLTRLFEEPHGSRIILLAPLGEIRPSLLREELPHLRQRGFQRVRLDGEIVELEQPGIIRGGREPVRTEVVIDRLTIEAGQRSRLADSLELAFAEGQDHALALIQHTREGPFIEIVLSQNFACSHCGKVYEPVSARSFSYNHPSGACETCGGLGRTLQFAPELVVPDASLSTRNGVIKPWRLGSKSMIIERNATLRQLAQQVPFDPQMPWSELPEEVRNLILHGDPQRSFTFKLKAGNSKGLESSFDGVLKDLAKTFRETSSEGLKARLMAYQVSEKCPDCQGRRLNATSRSVLLGGVDFAAFMHMTIADAEGFAHRLGERCPEVLRLSDAYQGLQQRLRFLQEVGLDYLQLDRAQDTLSGGESQRVRLATQLGMGLVGVIYVLDEPTIGLHPSDNARLIQTLHKMRDRGNTVIVVEHDPDMMKAADHLVELGPGAGEQGGRLIFAGSPEEACTAKGSRTGSYLGGHQRIERDAPRKEPEGGWLTVKEARAHNLQSLTVGFPVGLLTVVTGVSGSGKSSLVNEVLAKAAAFQLNRSRELPGPHSGIDGLRHFEGVIRVDQQAIGQSPRSNPATYTKLFDPLRQIFAETPLAKVRGYSAGRFSFNTPGGRCERCKGDGAVKLDMHFLADVFVECPSCGGQRYNRETLEIRFKGKNIAEVLQMTIDEAATLFRHLPKILNRLATLQAVGLGYLRLGQPANTLSGGEAQRLKLSLELAKRFPGPTLYILDEPTTGLHWIDVQMLIDLLFRLRDQGHTLVVIEHNLDLIRLADWVIDLGPGAGSRGGRLVYSGPPEGLASCPESLTGRSFREG